MSQRRYEDVMRDLLSHADIQISGSRPFDMKVHDNRVFRRILAAGALGLGESYMDGWWDCDQLDEFICRVMKARLEQRVRRNWRMAWPTLRARLFNLQKPSRAYQVGQQHYDVGNELYCRMLDPWMNYTCGYWRDAEKLNEAQVAKMDMICRKVELEPGMKVLDLGCGFGGFAAFAAKQYGVHVTGVTVSRKQVEWAREHYADLPVDIRLEDYRNVTGRFDRVISIGIMEHVGYKNYHTYMEVVDQNLKPDGIALIHTIGRNTPSTTANAWTTRYIFPNGMLPSVTQIAAAMEPHFVMEDWHNFGPDYDRTLMAWHENFERSWSSLKGQYDGRFYRMWKYYLLSCAGGFRSRTIQLWQVVMTRPGREQPHCRLV